MIPAMRIQTLVQAAITMLALVGLVACGGGGGSGASAGDGGSDGTVGDGALSDANLSPDVFGAGPGNGSCLALGASCKSNADCCSSDCANGFCNYPQCQTDNGACTASGQCCSQNCSGGKCVALNATCGTIGNQCTSNAACCSGLCSSGTCQPSSFCVQAGDACATSGDCCTGVCNIASGQKLGTCAATPPAGAANCGMVDGQLCGGTAADGGATFLDSGLPQCGGPCCSRSCAPWGPTGVLVCQPASGCHPVGDLCTTDTDCCGSAGLPGGSGQPVTCDRSGGGPLGVCRLPMGCKPNGDVCKLATMTCNSSCDCCAGNCEKEETCKQDNVGVPRCANLNCGNAGASCASSADCCSNVPCVPNPSGNPPYVCYGSSCVAACGACTNNADCCPGSACEIPQGSTKGVCGPCSGTTGTDGGTTTSDGGTITGDAGTTPPSDAGTCALFGQVCTTSSQCCYGLPCSNGRCGAIQ